MALYVVTVFVASIIPGPSMLLALTHGMQYGPGRTMASALGNVSVTIVQASVSMAGLGAVLIASETVFRTIQWAGAAYLIFIGISLFRSSSTDVSPFESGLGNTPPSLGKMYVQAALVTAGNPKAIVFFTAIFPQFIDHNTAFLPQFCLLVLICALIAFCCFMIYALSGNRIVSLFQKETIRNHVNKVMGGTFIGAGIGLAVSRK